MKHFIFGGLLGLGALAFLAGCGDEAKTNDYYKTHIDEAKARVAECKKMEKMNETQQRDCSNAKWAVETEDTGYIEKTWGKSNPDALKWK
ncbi:EexN family lipoprotein [Campylobacter coli]|uniref:EexN family lipoprotein n=1 Tax=Campylobacter coli TaxID=195 RepID=UPI00276CB466|nr:EexN family lipoprotein [Campylobacter coli]MDP8545691.1 EexN family lipoprotein [Campylobacter coli]